MIYGYKRFMRIDDPTMVYILSLVIVSFSLLTIAMVVLYIRLLLKYQNAKEIAEKSTGVADLEETQKKAKTMIEEARVKAGEIVTQAEIFTSNQKNVLLEEINKATHTYADKYQSALKFAEDEAVRMISQIPDQVKSEVMVRIEKFTSGVETELLNAQKYIQASVKESYQKAEIEVENYKLERLKQVDDSIMKMVEEVSRRVLAKEITADEHEKLVLKALEKAKEENILVSQEKPTEK